MDEENKTGDATSAETGDATAEGGWDKERQRIDQAEATVKKIATERQQLQEEVDVLTGQLEEQATGRKDLQDRLSKVEGLLQDKASEAKVDDLEQIDPETTDPRVLKVIRSLQTEQANLTKQLKVSGEKIQQLEEAKTTIEKKEQQREIDDARERDKEFLLSTLDDEFGAKYRTEAVKLAGKQVKELGEAPTGDLKIYLFMRNCYQQVKEKAEGKAGKADTEKVQVDSGSGGVTFGDKQIEEGTGEQVLGQIAKQIKGGKITLPHNT